MHTIAQRIPFSKVSCDGNELAYVNEVLQSGWLTTAGKAFSLEKQFANAVQARYACAVNSCTAALHLGLEALGIGPGDKVLVPTMTFTSSAAVIPKQVSGSREMSSSEPVNAMAG